MLDVLRRAEADARARLPAEVYDYFAGGSGQEVSLGEADAAWGRHRLRPRVLRDVSRVNTTADVLGTRLAAPVLVAPSAYHGLAHPDAERETARGVGRADSLMVVSTRASVPLEDVAAALAPGQPWWLQVYVLRDRGLTAELVQRAAAAGARALVLTGDTPVLGRKKRQGRPVAPADPRAPTSAVQRPVPPEALEQDPSVGPSAVGWLAEVSGLPVLVKGVLRADDAEECVTAGAAGVVVSNHGGRQLDRAVASADALPEVAAALAGRGEVYVDGGIRSGTDILTALALGARAVLVGRPVLWGLAAAGADGVHAVLSALADDLTHVMALAGAASLQEVDASLLAPSGLWPPGRSAQ